MFRNGEVRWRPWEIFFTLFDRKLREKGEDTPGEDLFILFFMRNKEMKKLS